MSENISHHDGLSVLLAGEDGPGVEEGDDRQQGAVGDLRQEQTERLLVGTAALTQEFSTLIGPGPTRLGSHWSRGSKCCFGSNLMP